jgi:predicted nucleic acid-binding protein
VIVLDTSFLIRALAGGSAEDARPREWLAAGEPLAVSAIAEAELLCGPLDAAHAQLFVDGGRRRGSLTDCMIAAAALRAGVALATENPADFRRFEAAGLRVLSA